MLSTVSNAASATYAEVFMMAAQAFDVSPYHLVSRVLQEVGTKGSAAAHGTYSGYQGIYNFYSIGANTGAADGMRWASQSRPKYYCPWNTPYKSVVGGAKYIADGYINVGQSTLYSQKFDIIAQGGYYNHQYMSNIQAPYTEGNKMFKAYSDIGLLDSGCVFTIPVFNNMPSTPAALPARSSSPNLAGDLDGLPSAAAPVYPKNGTVVGTDSGLNVRPTASTSKPAVANLPNGTVIRILSKTGNWYYIEYNGSNRGYVSSNYIDTAYITSVVPAIYQSYISSVKADHPTWQFRFLYTDIDWSDLVRAQVRAGWNVVNSYTNPISFRSTTVNYNRSTNTFTSVESGTWFQAHGQVVRYYLDPRNFINTTAVFMFEELSYVEGLHNLDGVKKMLRKTFMDNVSINVDFTLDVNENRIYPDVANSAWYYEAVKYCKENEIFTGYSNGNFGPNDKILRQDFAILMARIAGGNLPKYQSAVGSFPDVKSGAYYTPSVLWANEFGVLSGYQNGKFGTGDPITREQICTMLYNYAESTFNDMSLSRTENEILTKYSDARQISSFARTAIAWCIDIGVISGKDAYHLAPTATATRAEIASIMQRAVESGMKYEGYTDVAPGSKYYDAIQYCTHKHFFSGNENGKFLPGISIQRQDFVVVLANAANVDVAAYANENGGFSDVAANSYYSSAICWAAENGIVSGYQDGRFGVGDSLTRQSICVILYRYTQSQGKSVRINDAIDDIISTYPDADSIDFEAQVAAAWCIENNIVQGNAEGNFGPKEPVSRGEIAYMLMRMCEMNIF